MMVFEDKPDYEAMWREQFAWLERLRDCGLRTKAMTALYNMKDIEERELKKLKEKQ